MNPLLELRWKIAMLEHLPSAPYSAQQEERRAILIRDLESELRVQEAIFAKTRVDRDVRESIGLPPRR